MYAKSYAYSLWYPYAVVGDFNLLKAEQIWDYQVLKWSHSKAYIMPCYAVGEIICNI